ncbi:MAG: tRNA (adenosine(37)-N6)-threonylcarbamoyltransferase complex ATPase subunit type 1 TsaE [Anaerolineae bacterium]
MRDNVEVQTLTCFSAEETYNCGKKLGRSLVSNSIVAFFGDLGSGKTTFVKGLGSGIGLNPQEITSPTFTYLNIYAGSKVLYHFDLYRLSSVDDFISMGFEDYWSAEGICCIEWSEKIRSILPIKTITICMESLCTDTRKITIQNLIK